MLREIVFNEIFTVLLVLCLILIAIAKFLYVKRFDFFVQILGNFRYLKIYSKNQKFIDGFSVLLLLNLLISSTIFCYLLYINFIGKVSDPYTLLIKLFVSIAVVFLVKIFVERLIGSLFNITDYVDNYLFQKMSYKFFIGLLLIPINAILLFSIIPNSIILQTLVVFFVFINFIGLIASYKTYQNIIKTNLVYFILYLCTLEISPYLVLYKLFIDYN